MPFSSSIAGKNRGAGRPLRLPSRTPRLNLRWLGLWCLLAAGFCLNGFGQEAAPPLPPGNVPDTAPDGAPGKAPPGEQLKHVGKLVRIEAPITNVVITRVIRMAKTAIAEAKRNGQWPVIIFEIQPGKTSFGLATDMAGEILQLGGADTVAYIPKGSDGQAQALRGHGVLVALACDMIVMPADGKIGEAGADEPHIGPHIKSGYLHVASSRRTVPEDLVLGMLDPDLAVWEVENELTTEFVRDERLEELKKQKTVVVREPALIPRGKAGIFSGEEARRLGIVRFLVDDRQEVARALGLSLQDVTEDPSLDGGWRPVQVVVNQDLSPKYVAQVQRKLLEQVERQDKNLVILKIDSPGGSPVDALQLARFLADLPSDKCRTVAYIPHEARADAAFLALACDRIVMHPTASIGGALPPDFGIEPPREPPRNRRGPNNVAPPPPREDRERTGSRGTIIQDLQRICRDKGRPYSIPQALFDSTTVYRFTRKSDGMVAYFSQAEVQSQPDPDQWEQGEVVADGAKPLELDGPSALRLALATDVVNSESELKALFGLEGELPIVQPHWVDTLVDALTQPWVLFLLITIGLTAFMAELHNPGTGLGGFVATVCFLLFFWGNYLGGTADWLEILLFAVGMVFILLEIFVMPGVGIFGVGGSIMVIASLVMALQTFTGLSSAAQYFAQLRGSLLMVVGAGATVTALIVAMRYYLPKTPHFNRGLVLNPPGAEVGDQPTLAGQFDHFLNEKGVAHTRLTPSGKVRIGEQLVDVVSEGEFIARGTEVVVSQVQGNRIVVRSV